MGTPVGLLAVGSAGGVGEGTEETVEVDLIVDMLDVEDGGSGAWLGLVGAVPCW